MHYSDVTNAKPCLFKRLNVAEITASKAHSENQEAIYNHIYGAVSTMGRTLKNISSTLEPALPRVAADGTASGDCTAKSKSWRQMAKGPHCLRRASPLGTRSYQELLASLFWRETQPQNSSVGFQSSCETQQVGFWTSGGSLGFGTRQRLRLWF